jgi:hypothetical protein
MRNGPGEKWRTTSMKMAITPSPWRYDVSASHALQLAMLQWSEICRYASWPVISNIARWSGSPPHKNAPVTKIT